ncbi:MAG: hypothetical protein ACLQFR_09070 [Streptosporangiaceae bacterium]
MSDVQNSADGHDLGGTAAAMTDVTGLPPSGQPADESVSSSMTVIDQALAPADLVSPPPLTAVQLALYAGWTMAVLYGDIQAPPAGSMPELPTGRELQPPQRRELEVCRLNHLLQHLSDLPGVAQPAVAPEITANYADQSAIKGPLQSLNLTILEALTAAPPEIQLAYELGRSLRDTVNPPPEYAAEGSFAPAIARQFGRERISKLQEWLATLSSQFPPHAGAVVSTSLGRWSELAAAAVPATGGRLKKGDARSAAATMREYLLPQGDVWLMLLTGAQSAAGLLTPEAYVAAGEAALRRSAVIVRRIIRHYWAVLVIVAAALAGILYLAVSNLAGAAEVWTSIAAVGGSFGVSANAITSRTSRLAAEAQQPVFAMAEEDAMAWSITALPAVELDRRGVQQLRQAGITPRTSLGRV